MSQFTWLNLVCCNYEISMFCLLKVLLNVIHCLGCPLGLGPLCEKGGGGDKRHLLKMDVSLKFCN